MQCMLVLVAYTIAMCVFCCIFIGLLPNGAMCKTHAWSKALSAGAESRLRHVERSGVFPSAAVYTLCAPLQLLLVRSQKPAQNTLLAGGNGSVELPPLAAAKNAEDDQAKCVAGGNRQKQRRRPGACLVEQ